MEQYHEILDIEGSRLVDYSDISKVAEYIVLAASNQYRERLAFGRGAVHQPVATANTRAMSKLASIPS